MEAGLIALSGLEFAYPNSGPLFRGLALTLEPGRHLALLGASGTGKTTLLRILAGLIPVPDGVLTFDGKPWSTRRDREASAVRNRHLGIIFQNYNLLPNLTVAENLALRLSIAEQAPEPGRAEDLLARVDLVDYLHTPVSRLSGGQQQRIAAVRALITQPRVLLADEPTGNLDDHSAARIIELLADDPSRTVVVATHDVRVLERFPERLILSEVGS